MRPNTVLTGALCASLVLCAAFLVRSREQSDRIRTLELRLAESIAFPRVSEWVPGVRVPTLRGDTVQLGRTTAGRPGVVFALSTSCPYCLASLDEWQFLESEVRERFDGVDVWWLSLSGTDSTQQFAEAHDLDPSRVIVPSEPWIMRWFRIKGGPLTLVYSAEGQLMHMRPMTLSDRTASDSVLQAVATVMRAPPEGE